MIDNNMQNKA